MSFQDYGHLFPHYAYRTTDGMSYRAIVDAVDAGSLDWDEAISLPDDLSCSLQLASITIKSEGYQLADRSLAEHLEEIRHIGPVMIAMWQDYLGLDFSKPIGAISLAHREQVASLLKTLSSARREFEAQDSYEQLVQAKAASQPRPSHLRHLHQPKHSERLMDALFDDVRHSDIHVDRERSLAHTVMLNTLNLTNPETTYALQASFDFVLWYGDDNNPSCCVFEIDGSSHLRPGAQANDRMKNRICQAAKLPLIRINDQIFNDPGYEHYLSSLVTVIVTSSSVDTVHPLCQAVSEEQPLAQYVRWYDTPIVDV